jgi:hypothetical protein
MGTGKLLLWSGAEMKRLDWVTIAWGLWMAILVVGMIYMFFFQT